MDSISGIWLMFTYLANNTELGKFLPISPFQRFVANWEGWATIRQYLGYVNWFIPVSILVDILAAWCVAIGIFYGIQAILRWIRLIGS